MKKIMKYTKAKIEFLHLLMFCTSLFLCVPTSNAQTVRYWIEPDGKVLNKSSSQTHREIEEALKEISNICKIKFKKTASVNAARVRYYFAPENQTENGSLGLANGSTKNITINTSSQIGAKEERGGRYVKLVAQHSMLYLLRWKNESNLKVRFRQQKNFNELPDDFNRLDVYYLQKKFGKHRDLANNQTGEKGWKHRDGIPDVTFIPAELAAVGRQHQQDVIDGAILHQERKRLLAERDESVDPIYRSAKQKEVLANLDLILAHNVQQIASGLEWHLINFSWIGVHGYHFDHYGPQKEE